MQVNQVSLQFSQLNQGDVFVQPANPTLYLMKTNPSPDGSKNCVQIVSGALDACPANAAVTPKVATCDIAS